MFSLYVFVKIANTLSEVRRIHFINFRNCIIRTQLDYPASSQTEKAAGQLLLSSHCFFYKLQVYYFFAFPWQLHALIQLPPDGQPMQ